MNVITIQQPWVWAICRGGKRTENRSHKHGEARAVAQWSRAKGPFLVHSAGRYAGEEALRVVRHRSPVDPGFPGSPLRPTEWEFGAIVAEAEVTGVHGASSCYDPVTGRYCTPWAEPNCAHLDIADDVAILRRAIPAKGQLGVWQINDPDLLAEIRRQLP